MKNLILIIGLIFVFSGCGNNWQPDTPVGKVGKGVLDGANYVVQGGFLEVIEDFK